MEGLPGKGAATQAALREAFGGRGRGVMAFIEVMLNQELSEPFRSDAMRNSQVPTGHAGPASRRARDNVFEMWNLPRSRTLLRRTWNPGDRK